MPEPQKPSPTKETFTQAELDQIISKFNLEALGNRQPQSSAPQSGRKEKLDAPEMQALAQLVWSIGTENVVEVIPLGNFSSTQLGAVVRVKNTTPAKVAFQVGSTMRSYYSLSEPANQHDKSMVYHALGFENEKVNREFISAQFPESDFPTENKYPVHEFMARVLGSNGIVTAKLFDEKKDELPHHERDDPLWVPALGTDGKIVTGSFFNPHLRRQCHGLVVETSMTHFTSEMSKMDMKHLVPDGKKREPTIGDVLSSPTFKVIERVNHMNNDALAMRAARHLKIDKYMPANNTEDYGSFNTPMNTGSEKFARPEITTVTSSIRGVHHSELGIMENGDINDVLLFINAADIRGPHGVIYDAGIPNGYEIILPRTFKEHHAMDKDSMNKPDAANKWKNRFYNSYPSGVQYTDKFDNSHIKTSEHDRKGFVDIQSWSNSGVGFNRNLHFPAAVDPSYKRQLNHIHGVDDTWGVLTLTPGMVFISRDLGAQMTLDDAVTNDFDSITNFHYAPPDAEVALPAFVKVPYDSDILTQITSSYSTIYNSMKSKGQRAMELKDIFGAQDGPLFCIPRDVITQVVEFRDTETKEIAEGRRDPVKMAIKRAGTLKLLFQQHAPVIEETSTETRAQESDTLAMDDLQIGDL